MKKTLFGSSWERILKNYCHIRNQHPLICQIPKIRKKLKKPKFGTKSALLGIFDRVCPI